MGQNGITKHVFCILQSGLTKTRSLGVYIEVLALLSLQNQL